MGATSDWSPMLKTVPALLTPELLHSLALMGHGDVLAIVDRNYPAAANHPRVHPLAGADVVQAARAVLRLLPVDDFIEPAAYRMVPDGGLTDPVGAHVEFGTAVVAAEGRPVLLEPVGRTAFYDLARSAFAVVTTSETRPYSCFLLVKGVVTASDDA